MNDNINDINYLDKRILLLQQQMSDLLAAKLEMHSKILSAQGKEIAELQERVTALEAHRNAAIKADLLNGMKGKDAATKYNLSEGRISQIKNSDKRH